MQRDIEREEAKNPEASRWTVDETWLHSSDTHRHDGDAKKDEPPN
jgi:hypothetical protein